MNIAEIHLSDEKTKDLKAEPLKGGTMWVCEGMEYDGLTSFDQVLTLYNLAAKHHPNCRPLITLNGYQQACYTSGHSEMSWNLDKLDEKTIATLKLDCSIDADFDDLDFSTRYRLREYHFRQKLNDKHLKSKSYSLGRCNVTFDFLRMIQQQPQRLMAHDFQQAALHIVPSTQSADGMIAFPNGYFGDMTPFQCHSLASTLEEDCGFKLFGVGDSLLGFIADVPPTKEQLKKVDCKRVRSLLQGNTMVFLPYTQMSDFSEDIKDDYADDVDEWLKTQ